MSLLELARTISTITEELEKYKDSRPDTEDDSEWLASLPNNLRQSRVDLVDALQDLKYMVLDADSLLEDLHGCHTDVASLHTIYSLKLPQNVPLHSPIAYVDVATSTGISEPILRRLFHYAMTNYFFTEPKPGYVAHTKLSRMLATNPEAFDALGMTIEELAPAGPHLVTALRAQASDENSERTAYSIAHDTDMSVYQVLGANPERGRRFGAGMRHFTSGENSDLRYLLDAFPWSTYDRDDAVLVDVGGGQGAVTTKLASATTKLHFVVEDLDTETGKALLADGLKSRVDFKTHNFFDDQPVQNADIYFFRWIMHNWSDQYCVKILRALIPALKSGAKILAYEHVLSNEPSTKRSEKGGRYLDMVMLSCFNGSTRTENQWKALFLEADKRFAFNEVRRVQGGALSLVEVTWDV